MILHNMQIMQFSRRNDWREAAEKPLNRHLCMAAAPANAAEMAQLQRIAPVMPPRADLGTVAADARERSAENAKKNTIEPSSRQERRVQSRVFFTIIGTIHYGVQHHSR